MSTKEGVLVDKSAGGTPDPYFESAIKKIRSHVPCVHRAETWEYPSCYRAWLRVQTVTLRLLQRGDRTIIDSEGQGLGGTMEPKERITVIIRNSILIAPGHQHAP